MIRVIYFLLIFLSPFFISAQQSLSFEEEDITFEIKDNIFFVDGIYYFHSETKHQYPIIYPFPKDTIYGMPFNIKVENLITGENLSYKYNNDSSSVIFFAVIENFTPIKISYQQELKSNKAKYILTTTKYWNKPLKQVGYKLVTDINFNIKSFSILPDKEIMIGNKQIYLWNKINFFPDIDFELEF